MLRLIGLIALFFMIVWVGQGLFRPSGRTAPPPGPGERVFVQDAHTGVYFPKSEAITVITDGETYYFSSIDHRDAWLSRRGGRG